MLIILLGCFFNVFLYFIYSYLLIQYNYWKARGVKYDQPMFFLGNMFALVVRRINIVDFFFERYTRYRDERYFGIYQFLTPTLVVNDPDLIKQICIKDFEYFPNHRLFSNAVDPIWRKALFSSVDNKWRDMRSILSPAFTSSKMKGMFNLISDCAVQFVDFFVEKDEDVITVEMKDILTRYSNDVIATCAFGVECNSLRDRQNEFYKRGCEVTNFTLLKVVGFTLSPKLMQLPHEKPLTIEKGSLIWFPIIAIQRDAKYFPEPDKFIPERFSAENTDKLTPNTFLSFGIGPRGCLASRFAQMETKAIIFHLLTKFQFVSVEKTVIPVQLSKKKYNLSAKGGMWLGLKRRK